MANVTMAPGGFTLTELVPVVGMIRVLAAIAVLNMLRARASADEASAVALSPGEGGKE